MKGAGLLGLALLAACAGDETVTAYGAAGPLWSLTEMDGAPPPAPLTLSFETPGEIAGQAPCNAFSAQITAPYPWFALGPVAMTKRGCPDLAAEARLMARLSAMTLAEASGPLLILRNDAGARMVFTAAPSR